MLGCTFVKPVEEAEKTRRREKQRAGEYYNMVILEHKQEQR